jgi:hypothetical protein
VNNSPATFVFCIGRVEAVVPAIRVTDLSDQGVRLIGPGDPLYQDTVAAFEPTQSNPIVERLLPYWVFLKNTGSRDVVAYRVRWEWIEPDGSLVIRDDERINFGALTSDPGFINAGYSVARDAIRLITPFTSSGEGEMSGGISAIAGGTKDPTRIGEILQAAKSVDSFLDFIVSELMKCTQMRASLDGVVFDDGVFAGPDNTQFFAAVKASVDARRGLLNQIKLGRERGHLTSRILEGVAEVAVTPNVTTLKTGADYYSFYKKSVAEQIMHIRRAVGDERAIDEALRPLSRPWIRVRRE